MKGTTTTTWYLQMLRPPEKTELQELPGHCTVMHIDEPTRSYYLYLYTSVGRPYQWYNRLMMQAGELESVIGSESTDIWVLFFKGVPAGFVEFNTSENNETEMVYFGLSCEFTGRKLGMPFLNWCISKAWERKIDRLWLHTCDLDHKAALGIYKKAGFEVYDEDTVFQQRPDPEDDPYLLLPW